MPSEGSDIAPIFLQKSPSKCISREAFYDSYEIVENVLEARIMTVDILSADGCKKAYNIDISLNQFCGKAPLSKVFLQVRDKRLKQCEYKCLANVLTRFLGELSAADCRK